MKKRIKKKKSKFVKVAIRFSPRFRVFVTSIEPKEKGWKDRGMYFIPSS